MFKDIVKLVLPLILIPLTLYAVLSFGQGAGDIIIGIAFFITIVKFANKNERRFMIILAVFAILFETANVALGAYRYLNVLRVPGWVGLGWGVVGIYLVKNLPIFKKIENKFAYGAAIIIYGSILLSTGVTDISLLIPSLFAIASVYVLSLASSLPPAFFLSAGLLGIIIEALGTYLKIWTYFDDAGKVVAPSFAPLAIAYASVVAFALWVSGVDSHD